VSDGADLRKAAGQRTRDGLLDAAMVLLARRGQDGVTLRELTDSAGANVSAVSYHFGSLQALCDAAIEQALDRYLGAQIEQLQSLDAGSTLHELAVAFARPMLRAFKLGGIDLAIMRTVARAGIDPPAGWQRLADKFDRTRRLAVRVLAANLPGVSRNELAFRTRCAAGMLNWLVIAPIGDELAAAPAERVERWLVPVLAGAFRGAPSSGLRA